MKEATGELNSTVVVMISIGVLSTFFFTVLWPMIKGNFESEAQCNKAICECSKEIREGNEGNCLCHVDSDPDNKFKCVYKG